MLKSLSTFLILRGILAVAFGIIVAQEPSDRPSVVPHRKAA